MFVRSRRLSFLCVRHALPMNYLPSIRSVNTSSEEKENDILRVKRMINKDGLKKKMKRRLQAELHRMELTNKIQSSQKKPETPDDHTSIREQFKQLPFETQTLEYIKKHHLHRSKAPPNIRQKVNSFVDNVSMSYIKHSL